MSTVPEILRETVSQVLEDMYFCDGTWLDSGPLEATAIGARIEFSGSLSGEFRLVATTRLAAQLTADFLAVDVSGITELASMELLQEFANVACGATLSAWMPDASFSFSIPSGLTNEEALRPFPHRLCIDDTRPELAVDLVLAPL